MALVETYRLTEADLNALRIAVQAYDPAKDSDIHNPPADFGSLELLGLILDTVQTVEVTYEGPYEEGELDEEEPDLCGNCAKPLDGQSYSSYACTELCEEAILERQHEEEAREAAVGAGV